MANPATSLNTVSLTLHATVPAARHTQLLHILAGLCGHPPVAILERHLVFRTAAEPPRRIAADEGGGTQDIVDREKARRKAEREAREGAKWRGYVRYVVEEEEEVELSRFGVDGAAGPITAMDVDDSNGVGKVNEAKMTKWTRRFWDSPDPNLRSVTARKSEVMDVSDHVHNAGEAVKTAEEQGFRWITSYVVSGSRFVHDNIVLLLHRPLLSPSPGDPSTGVDLTNHASVEALKPVDDSGAYILEARSEILNTPGTSPSNDLLNRGIKEMTRFKDVMSGCVELRAVDRMSVNTRIG